MWPTSNVQRNHERCSGLTGLSFPVPCSITHRNAVSLGTNPLLSWVITRVSPHLRWDAGVHGEREVTLWAAATLTAPNTEEGSRCAVEALLQIASIQPLREYIPTDVWAKLKTRPSLPPVCWGRRCGTTPEVVSFLRRLEDPEILKAYFLLVWSEWGTLDAKSLAEMKFTISTRFKGTANRTHREDLINRLNYFLQRLGLGHEDLGGYNQRIGERDVKNAQQQYTELKSVLVGTNGNEAAGPSVLEPLRLVTM